MGLAFRLLRAFTKIREPGAITVFLINYDCLWGPDQGAGPPGVPQPGRMTDPYRSLSVNFNLIKFNLLPGTPCIRTVYVNKPGYTSRNLAVFFAWSVQSRVTGVRAES